MSFKNLKKEQPPAQTLPQYSPFSLQLTLKKKKKVLLSFKVLLNSWLSFTGTPSSDLFATGNYSASLPYILMGSLTVLMGLLSLLLPETHGMPLPDTITHMQRFPGYRCSSHTSVQNYIITKHFKMFSSFLARSNVVRKAGRF